ncbi:MAG: hypothetical protein DI538_06510 [Azospira oryzae]|nr:MAG: hypothetical protein DI538_06510 [Azospira oryzae]
MKFHLLVIVLVALLAVSCRKNFSTERLIGSWRTDSVYSYDNGYGLTYRDLHEEPLQHYEQAGRVKMTMGSESRWFTYELIQPDSLIIRNQNNKPVNKYLLLKLDEQQLVVKKQKPLIFSGPGQERYEIRYLSKIRE